MQTTLSFSAHVGIAPMFGLRGRKHEVTKRDSRRSSENEAGPCVCDLSKECRERASLPSGRE
eukprot:5304895-Prymnesium_polylepis.3